MRKTFNLLIIFLGFTFTIFAQSENESSQSANDKNIYHNWFNKSPVDDNIFGAEVDKAYSELLKDKKTTTVIVAVIDGGVDIQHEDLKDRIWINEDEIADNGIDDDHNGYIDDIHGWNYIGNDKGENIVYENLEITRIYKKYKDRFENIDPKSLSKEDKELYDNYTIAKSLFIAELNDATEFKTKVESFETNFNYSYDTLLTITGKDSLNIEDLESINTDDKRVLLHVSFLKRLFTNGFKKEILVSMKEHYSEELDYHLNIDFNPREIINDDLESIDDVYGNNEVCGPDAFHGTFVAGIIAAVRDNNLGIDGIASDVKIIGLRAVPNGDERDKDVAKAIRYAVDNGAKIINMSFGKELSPQKHLVDDAILYAEEKGVLLVHASGNDAIDIDKIDNYPTKVISKEKQASNFVTVGASSINNDLEFAAEFSNYGKKMVDLFAPGVSIESLAPENKYEIADGTSFSAPVVSGVAALLLSYYPDLTYTELKNIIIQSSLNYSKTKVYLPNETSGKKKKTKFGKLSSTGGIVSAYEALKMVDQLKK